jgi:dUTP pyrophosphatase
MKIIFEKKHPNATTPTKAHEEDACFDLYACEDQIIAPGQVTKVNCGIAFQTPEGWECQVRGRSGNASKGLWVHFGTGDANYPEAYQAIVVNVSGKPWVASAGNGRDAKPDRICQVKFERVESVTLVEGVVTSTKRQSGFGSTGK